MSDGLPILGVSSIDQLFEGSTRDRLEREVLPDYLPRQRWFSSKARALTRTRILDEGRIGPGPVLTVVRAEYQAGGAERYSVPLALATGDVAETRARGGSGAAIAWLDAPGRTLLVDGLADDQSCRHLITALSDPADAPTLEHRLRRGAVRVTRDRIPLFAGTTDLSSLRRTGAEQTNSSIVIGSSAVLKMYRKLEAGIHPELEMGRYLWTHGFTDVPQVLASLEYMDDGSPAALAVLHAFVPDAQDGWQHALEHVGAFYKRRVARRQVDAGSAGVGPYLDAARVLGDQTGHLHLTLATATEPDMAPEPMTVKELRAVAHEARERADRVFELLTHARRGAFASAQTRFDALFERRDDLRRQLDALVSSPIDANKARCHQDFHLGQLLWAGTRYALLDFEGEPLRPLSERRRKRSPLTDVAGMLRSYSYAAWSGLFDYVSGQHLDAATLEPFAREWESAVATEFLSAYLTATEGASFIPAGRRDRERLLRLLTIDKALYELEYELNNRPAWILVPVEGLLRLI